MKIGKPHHLVIDSNTSVCGIGSPDYHTDKIEKCNCYRCMKTKIYRDKKGVTNA